MIHKKESVCFYYMELTIVGYVDKFVNLTFGINNGICLPICYNMWVN